LDVLERLQVDGQLEIYELANHIMATFFVDGFNALVELDQRTNQ